LSAYTDHVDAFALLKICAELCIYSKTHSRFSNAHNGLDAFAPLKICAELCIYSKTHSRFSNAHNGLDAFALLKICAELCIYSKTHSRFSNAHNGLDAFAPLKICAFGAHCIIKHDSVLRRNIRPQEIFGVSNPGCGEMELSMSRLMIEGGSVLSGTVSIHGAKNSALPILAATILAHGPSEIHNCPFLSDVAASVRILRYLGCDVYRADSSVSVDSRNIDRSDVPDSLMREMRSSIVFLGAIAARTGEAHMSFPGGCELGQRPIDLHLWGLRQLGMEIVEEGGKIICKTNGRLRGSTIPLSFPSVGATENILLAAATADGTTIIHNAAREPEIEDLCNYLNSCGARISGAGESTITVEGIETLVGCHHSVIPDRIETVTYMAAAAVTGGTLMLRNICPAHISTVIPIFEEAGCRITLGERELLIRAQTRPQRVRSIRTMPYPGFPTDAQAPIMAMTCITEGTSVFVESIFENRFKHVGELMRLGANIRIEGRMAVVEGVDRLSGAEVECTDLRGGAALVIAGLAAEGMTEVTELRHIDRGYERLEKNLQAAGAVIRRLE